MPNGKIPSDGKRLMRTLQGFPENERESAQAALELRPDVAAVMIEPQPRRGAANISGTLLDTMPSLTAEIPGADDQEDALRKATKSERYLRRRPVDHTQLAAPHAPEVPNLSGGPLTPLDPESAAASLHGMENGIMRAHPRVNGSNGHTRVNGSSNGHSSKTPPR
jgi:hypothetical protein